MKKVQKLEIAAGVATFVSTFAYFCVFMLPYAKFAYENDGTFRAITVLLTAFPIFVIPGILTAFGVYLWAVRANSVGFALVISGALTTAFVDFVLVAGVTFYSPKRMMLLLLLSMPLIFPILTLVFAFGCRKLYSLPS